MPLRIFLRPSLALLLLAAPIAVRADFPAPNPDELKMTSEPKAPGAGAVYLYREETTLDNKHYQTMYERIKVLTEKGKELATVRIPYEHGEFFIKEIEARTVHADGTIVPLNVKPSDLVDFKMRGLQLNVIVFTLPSVEVGSVLEYRVKLSYDDETIIPPVWHIQQKYFTREAHFQFHPRDVFSDHAATFTTNLPDPKKIFQDKRGYVLDLTDVPPEPDEDWMPPLNTTNWHVRFYYWQSADNSTFWSRAAQYWTEGLNDFTAPTPFLTATANSLIASTDTPAQKAQKLYAAVQKLENTSFTRTLSEAERKNEKQRKIKKVDDIWKNQRGNSAAMTFLYLALARSAGLTVYPMQVVNRDRAIFDPDYHSDEQLDDYLAIVVLDGKETYLDPGEKMCPFGQLHWKHTFATGLRGTDKGTKVARTPGIGASVKRFAELAVSNDGAISGDLRIVMAGAEALRWRQAAILEDPEAVKKSFNEALNRLVPEGIQVEFDHFVHLEDVNESLLAVAKVSGTLAASTGKRMFLPGLFFAARARHPFITQDKRVTPIDVHFPLTTEDDVIYDLPAGYTVESSPQSTAIDGPQHASFKVESKPGAVSVDVTRALSYRYVLLGPSDYPELHDFYQKIATADQQQVVLTRAQTAKRQ